MLSGWVLVALVVVAVGIAALVSWFFLRSGGLLENARKNGAGEVEFLSNSLNELSHKLAETDLQVRIMKNEIEELTGMMNRRIGAFETRYAKAAKEDLRQEAFAAIRQMNQQ